MPWGCAGGGASAGGHLRGYCCCCCYYYYCYFYFYYHYYFSPFANGSREPGHRCAPGTGGAPRGQQGDARPPSSGAEKVEGRDLGRRRRRGEPGPSRGTARPGSGGHGGHGGVRSGTGFRHLRPRSAPCPARVPAPRAAEIRFPWIFRWCLFPWLLEGAVAVVPRFGGFAELREGNRPARLTNLTAAQRKKNPEDFSDFSAHRGSAGIWTGTGSVCPRTVPESRRQFRIAGSLLWPRNPLI